MKQIKLLSVGHGIRFINVSDDMLYAKEGGYGKVYSLDRDTLAKVYYVKFPVKAKKDTKEVLKKIKNLNIDGMYDIYDFLYSRNNLEFKGYTMGKVNGLRLADMPTKLAFEILEMPTSYVVNNYIKLDQINRKLSNNGIFISDDFGSSIICHDGTFTVTDVDSYLYRPDRVSDVKKENDELIRTFSTAVPIKAAMKLRYQPNEIEKIRENAKKIFFEDVPLCERIYMLEKGETLVKSLLK